MPWRTRCTRGPPKRDGRPTIAANHPLAVRIEPSIARCGHAAGETIGGRRKGDPMAPIGDVPRAEAEANYRRQLGSQGSAPDSEQAISTTSRGGSTNGVSMTVTMNVRHAAALAAVLAGLSGCAAVQRPIRDAIHPPGQMSADGTIYPCHGYKTEPQACGDAIYNSARIGQVALGQTIAEVRAIMGRDAETRSVSVRDGHNDESWGFRTDYERRITTTIEFVDGKVVAIRQDRA